MEAENLLTQLSEYMSTGWNQNDDFFNFVKGLIRLSRKIQMIKKAYNPYIPVAKKWITAFQIIRSKNDISKEMQAYMSKLCSVVTIGFLRLAKSFREYDPNYTQEFYCHWTEFLSVMTTSKRASSFIRYDVLLNQTFIQHLKAAKNRCEQISILRVLTLYTAGVLPMKLPEIWQKVKRNKKTVFDDDNLINNLIQLGPKPSLMDQHAFLQAINVIGAPIITFKPTKIVCENLELHFTVTEDEMWIDFNLKDRSILFAVLSKDTGACRCIGIVTLPDLKEYVNSFGEYMLTIEGPWNFLATWTEDPIRIVVSITMILPIEVRNVIWKQNERSFFKVLPKTNLIHARKKNFDTNRVRAKKRRFSTMILEHSSSYSSSDFEVQPKIPRSEESSMFSKTKVWNDVFDILKYQT